MPNGEIQKEHKDRLRQIGEWIKKNGETIYGTRRGSISLEETIVSTRKGNKIYVHILELDQNEVVIPDFHQRIKKIVFFKDKIPVKYKLKKGELKFTVPENKKDELDTILEITLR